MATRWVIGLAAGPSADGIDAVLLQVEGLGLDLRANSVHSLTQPYAKELRELIVKCSTPGQADVRQISLAHRLLGEAFALAARQLADRASVSLHSVLCIGCSGHTAWHEGDGRFPSTLSLGTPAIVAERTGLTTISDFRARDQAGGGQGAPIGALVDHLLFRDHAENRLVLHLGGLAQVVFLPAGEDLRSVLGWEAGPCTILLDALIQQVSGGQENFDTGGKHAVQGKQIHELFKSWLNHPFLLRRAPRTTHRAAFGEEFARQTVTLAQRKGWNSHDLLCTANHFVIHAIGASVRRFVPKQQRPHRVLLSGGGVKNGLFWRLLEEELAGVPLEKTDHLGVPAETKEATNAALLACLTLDGVPGNVPAATGAAGSRLLGNLTPGSGANWSRCLDWMTGQVSEPLEEED